MYTDLLALLFTLAGVTLAEMGDKTQLLAMALATKYETHQVLIGISIAIVLLSSTAVALGNYITRFEGLQIWIQGIAALSFLIFGLWTLVEKGEGEDENTRVKLSPVLTVIAAFFIAELGDKTQLATMAFATRFPQSPVAVFIGGTFGLVIANAVGIVFGGFISKRISERAMKIASSFVFMLFGFIGCYQVAADMLKLNIYMIIFALGILAVVTGYISITLVKKYGSQVHGCEEGVEDDKTPHENNKFGG
ncbi:MAG: TMEM165/GDT1 family protein [Caulobacteraceae bacterium]